MKIRFLLFAMLLTSASAFAQSKNINFQEKLEAITNAYFMAYNAHDVEQILRFYTDQTVLIDVHLDHQLSGKANFRKVADQMFNGDSDLYEDLRFKIFGMEQDGYMMTVKGEMQNLRWNPGYLENWKFTSRIYFNEEGKIIKQEDEVDYPSDVKTYLQKD